VILKLKIFGKVLEIALNTGIAIFANKIILVVNIQTHFIVLIVSLEFAGIALPTYTFPIDMCKTLIKIKKEKNLNRSISLFTNLTMF
jgi:hypothetical protein